MTDAERLVKRLEILSQVNQILKLCHCSNTHLKQSCEHCKKLIPLGERLLKLSKPRKNITTSGEIITPKKDSAKPVGLFSVSLEIDDYVKAKLNKMSDCEFYKQRNVNRYTFAVWKKENLNEINRLKKLKAK